MWHEIRELPTAPLGCDAVAFVKAASPLQCAVTKNASVSALECAVTELLDLKSPGMNSYEKGVGGGWLHAGFRLSTTETSRRFGVDETCPPPKAFSAGCEGATGWVWSRRLRSSEHSPCFSNRRL